MLIECKHCSYRNREEAFQYGRGKAYGQHEEHRYCPRCGYSIDWVGFLIVQPQHQQAHGRRPAA